MVPNGDASKLSIDFNVMSLLDIYHTHNMAPDDTRTSGQPVQERGQMCPVHNQPIKLYCADCAKTFCHHCSSANAHCDHCVVIIEEARPLLENKIKELVTVVEENQSLLKSQLDAIDIAMATDDDSSKAIIDSVNAHYKEYNDMIEAKILKYQDILSRVRDHHARLVDELKQNHDCQKKQRQMERKTLCQSISDGKVVLGQASALLQDDSSDRVMSQGEEVTRRLQLSAQDVTLCDVSPTEYSLCQHKDMTEWHVISPRDIKVSLSEAKVKYNKFTVTLHTSTFTCRAPELAVTVTLPNGRTAPNEDVKITPLETTSWEVDYFVNQSSVSILRQNTVTVSVKVCGVEAYGSPFRLPCESKVINLLLGNY